MSTFKNKSALITGAGSGIGRAIAKELIKRGAKVRLTDINESSVIDVAESLGAAATYSCLDVRDADVFKATVKDFIESVGSIDFLFNNAGIGIGGESQDITVAHYDRIIDINIRGVTNGVAAVYPLMIQQGHVTIVNTASAAGLAPIPLLAAYSMTKHAVVGLSRSLRIEAANYGVRICALCPTAIETPILDSTGPSDLKNSWNYGMRDYLSKLAPPYPVDKFAHYALDKVADNQELIVAPFQGRIVARLFRYFPGLVKIRSRQLYKEELKIRKGTL